MIYEYAFHPNAWEEIFGKTELLNSIIRNMGVGTPCIAAGYPDVCAELLKIFNENQANTKDRSKLKQIDKKLVGLEEIQKGIYGKTTKRINPFNWDNNFQAEHQRHPFHTIITTPNNKQTDVCKDVNWLQGIDSPFFKHPRGMRVVRKSQSLANAVKPLLQNAAKITFVDPYFGTYGYDNPYQEYFKHICESAHVRTKTIFKVLIVCKWPHDRYNEDLKEHDFQSKCNYIFRKVDTKKVSIEVYPFQVTEDKLQEIHNRYILTDIGGVIFGHGTGESSYKSSSDQISLLEAEDLGYWSATYKPQSMYFDWSRKPICIPAQASNGE